MKITNISIYGFKGIDNIDYSPKSKTGILIGGNGLGKTSFLEALRFGLTGDAPDNCIRDGFAETKVEITLDDGTCFERMKHRTKPSKVKVNGKVTPAKNLDALIETLTGVSKSAMNIVTSGEVMTGLNPGEFGNFIMQYIPEELDFDTICGYIPGITSDAIKELSVALPAMPIKFGMDRVKECQNYLIEERKTVNKILAIHTAKTSSFVGNPPARSLAAIDADIENIMKIEGGYAAYKTAVSMYENAIKNKAIAEDNIKKMEQQIRDITATIPNPAELDGIKSKEKSIQSQIIAAKSLIGLIEKDIEAFEASLKNLNKPICPLSNTLICTTDKTAAKSEIEDIINANKEGLKIQNDLIESLSEELEGVAEKEKAYIENEKRYSEKVSLNARLESAKKAIPKLPPKPVEVEERDFKSELMMLRKERDECMAYNNYLKEVKETEAIQERYNTLNELCKAIQPKGVVMDEIMAHYINVFEESINDRASHLNNFAIKFTSEDGIRYLIKTDKTSSVLDYKPFESLSHGEQTEAMFLLLDMLNALSGLKLMLIDDLNHLDKESLESFFTLINSSDVQDDYDHIFIASVNNDDAMNAIKPHKVVDYIF